MQDFKRACLKLFLNNRRKAGKFFYTVPSPVTYPHQWLWDSCFHAIILSHFSPQDAKNEILSLVSKQFNNGLIPHMLGKLPQEEAEKLFESFNINDPLSFWNMDNASGYNPLVSLYSDRTV